MNRAEILDTAKPAEAVKHDSAKPRMDLIPPEALTALGTVLREGADKYGERNWELGMDWGRVSGALLRHLSAWMAGEATDPDSGMSHVWHVLTNAAFLTAYESRGVGNDDRKARRDAVAAAYPGFTMKPTGEIREVV